VQAPAVHNHKFDPIPQKDYYKMQASLNGYVETDFPAHLPRASRAYEKKLADLEAKIVPLKLKIREMEEPYRLKLAQEKYKRFPANVQRRHRHSEDQADTRRNAAGEPGASHHQRRQR